MAKSRFGTVSAKKLQLNGLSTLPSNQYHSTLNFPVSGASLYAWNLNGVSSFDGTDWNSGQNLAIAGTPPTQATDHLGNNTYCYFNGGVRVTTSSSDFDTSNQSFSIGAWINVDDTPSGIETIMSKWVETSDKRSWRFNVTATGIQLWISGTGTFGSAYDCTAITPQLFDSKWHFVSATYDTTIGMMTLFIDGKIVANRVVGALINTRYNSSDSELLVGAIADGTSEYFDGKISSCMYYKGVMTFSQIRQAYLIGSQKLGYLEGTKTRIMGETGPIGHYHIDNTYTASFTTNSDIPGFLLYAAETGKSRLIVNALVVLGSDGANLSMNIKNKTQAVDYVYSGYGEQLTGATAKYGRKTLISDFINLNKNDELVLYCTAKGGTTYFEDMTHAFIYELWDY